MKTIGTFEAKTRLSELLKKVGQGESFVITKRGKPLASLSPLNPVAKVMGPKEIVDEYRKKYAKSLRKYSQAEIKEMIAFGRR